MSGDRESVVRIWLDRAAEAIIEADLLTPANHRATASVYHGTDQDQDE